MDIKAYLLEQGLTEEEAGVLAGNEKYKKVLEGSAKQYEDARTAQAAAQETLTQAQKQKTDLETFWKTEATPKLLEADRNVAQSRAEKARLASYLQSLADQGYDIPKEYLSDMPNPAPSGTSSNPGPNPDYFTRTDAQKEFESAAENLTMIQDLNNEYHQLFGTFPTSLHSDLKEARAQSKGLRDFVRSKYNFDGKRQEIEQKKTQDLIDAKVKERVDAETVRLRDKYGPNADTRVQYSSQYDALRTGPSKDSWKTEAGRLEAKKQRLRHFENIRLQ